MAVKLSEKGTVTPVLADRLALIDDVGGAANVRLCSGTALRDLLQANLDNVTVTGGSITGITDLAVADGGTGASTAAAARTNLGAIGGTDLKKGAFIRKATTETVNNSTTLQNDDELFYALVAGQIVQFSTLLRVVTTTVANIKLAFTVPTGAVIAWSVDHVGAPPDATTGSGTAKSITAPGTVEFHVFARGFVDNSGTAGNLQLQWAQDTAEAADTRISGRSQMIVWSRNG